MKKLAGEIRLTVFTPAYNRAHTLLRTFASLRGQSCKDFIWLVIDDGSTDNTAELVKSWQGMDPGFEIRYVYKENGGMHTAHNTAYSLIDTELNVCIDSDDAMGDEAVRKILSKWEAVREKGYAGIIGLDADFDGNVIGKGFPEGLTETTVSGYYAAGGSGDKKLVYRTDVIREFPPYPVFPGEKYVALSCKYRLIDQKYNMAVLDDVLCRVEYQADGSSRNMLRQYARNPRGFAFWRKLCMQYPTGRKRLFVDCVHYVSSSVIARDPSFIKNSPRKLPTILALPFGLLLSAYIRLRCAK